jgi:hypothetical protein
MTGFGLERYWSQVTSVTTGRLTRQNFSRNMKFLPNLLICLHFAVVRLGVGSAVIRVFLV